MKKIQFYITVFISTLFIITSCNKNDFDYESAEREKKYQDSIENARVKGIIKSQAASLKTFADDKMPGATLVDSLGIWFIVDAIGEENSYTYSINSFGGITAPTVTVKYKGTLLNGTVFDKTDDDKTATFSLERLIPAWQIAFLPKSITFNGNTVPVTGLTTKGLKKGSKIRFVTSSPYAYDGRNQGTIPANSPLYFEIEVIGIQ